MDALERLQSGRIVEIVVAHDAEVGYRQSGDEPEVVLVTLGRPGAGEVAEVREERGRRIEFGDLAQQLAEDAVGGRVRPGSRVACQDEANGAVDRRALDPLRHAQVAHGSDGRGHARQPQLDGRRQPVDLRSLARV
ncbi:MAG: hypothetical protein E6G08_02625 [Actinobacteria bacterium]|nr:MAG: hypothetical protein E6G08_02625 [Actinomycetota bacterium]